VLHAVVLLIVLQDLAAPSALTSLAESSMLLLLVGWEADPALARTLDEPHRANCGQVIFHLFQR